MVWNRMKRRNGVHEYTIDKMVGKQYHGTASMAWVKKMVVGSYCYWKPRSTRRTRNWNPMKDQQRMKALHVSLDRGMVV